MSFLAIRSSVWLWFFINGPVGSRFICLPHPFLSFWKNCLIRSNSLRGDIYSPGTPCSSCLLSSCPVHTTRKRTSPTFVQFGFNRFFGSIDVGYVRSDSPSSAVASFLGPRWPWLTDVFQPSTPPNGCSRRVPLSQSEVSQPSTANMTASALNLHSGFNNVCPEDTCGIADVIFFFMCDEKCGVLL